MRARILVLVVLAAVGVLVWLAWSTGDARRAAEPRLDSPREADESARHSSAAAIEIPSERASADVATKALDEQRAASPHVDDRLHGRVVDAAGASLSGAEVELSFSAADGYSLLDLAARKSASVVARATSDARGEFAFEVAPLVMFQLDARAPGYARASLAGCRAGEHVVLTLQRSAVLFGRVTRRADGAPVAGARVEAWPKPSADLRPRGQRLASETDADGRYRVDGLAPGATTVDVEHESEASPEWASLDLAPGETREHDFVLDPGDMIRGRVTDALTGRPIAGAEVGQGWTFAKLVRTDVDGEYVLRGFSPGYEELNARARGYGTLELVVRDVGAGTVLEVADFALQPERRARGRVIDALGQPLPDAYVAAVASDFEDEQVSQRTDWRATVSGADGAFELGELRRDLRHTLLVRREGFGTVVYEFPDDESELALIELGDVTLPRAASISGEVVDEAGQPLARHPLELKGTNADRARWTRGKPAITWGIDLYVAQRAARTDDRGRFAITDLAPGRYTARVTLAENHAPAAQREVDVAEGEHVRDVRLVVARGLSITGRVMAHDGGERPTVYISVDPEGAGAAADCEVALDGGFSAQGLSPGPYRLTAYPYPSTEQRAAGRLFLETELAGIPSGARDVVITLRGAARVRGRVVDAAGVPVPGAWVDSTDAADVVVGQATTGADGSFEITVALGERATLRAGMPDAPGVAAAMLRDVDARAGALELVLEADR